MENISCRHEGSLEWETCAFSGRKEINHLGCRVIGCLKRGSQNELSLELRKNILLDY